jgi:hypothetical protein
MILDIAPAYQVPGLKRLERTFHFDISTGALTLGDRFEFDGPPLPITERFVSLYRPSVEDGTVIIDTGAGGCFLSSPEKTVPEIKELPHRDHKGREVPVYGIDFSFLPEEKDFSVEFTLR